MAYQVEDPIIPKVIFEDTESLVSRTRCATRGLSPFRELVRFVHRKKVHQLASIHPVQDRMRARSAPDVKRGGRGQVWRLLSGNDTTKPDLAGVHGSYVSADVAPHGGIDAVGAHDNAGEDLIPPLKLQAHAAGLFGETDQMIQVD